MYREELGNPLKDGNTMDTVAVGRTNIPGLENCTFKGASSKVREAAGLKDLDETHPNRAIVAPYNYKDDYHLEQYAKHAEKNVMAEFEMALEEAGISPSEAKDDRKGIFKQFTERYPNVNLYVSTYKCGGTGKGQGTLSFNVVDGKVTDVVKVANGRRY